MARANLRVGENNKVASVHALDRQFHRTAPAALGLFFFISYKYSFFHRFIARLACMSYSYFFFSILFLLLFATVWLLENRRHGKRFQENMLSKEFIGTMEYSVIWTLYTHVILNWIHEWLDFFFCFKCKIAIMTSLLFSIHIFSLRHIKSFGWVYFV